MSFYRILGVSRFATLDDIRQAYWSLSRRIRQTARDSGEADSLAKLTGAFETLSDVDRRRAYDAGTILLAHRVDRSRVSSRTAFESDVACGFPSMQDLVTRMYEAFSSLRSTVAGSIYTTRVELTACEANEGTQVPVDVTVQPSCPVCGGRGEFASVPCALCYGTGVGEMSQHVYLPVPPGVRDGARLRYSVTPPYSAEAQIELCVAVH